MKEKEKEKRANRFSRANSDQSSQTQGHHGGDCRKSCGESHSSFLSDEGESEMAVP
jgi:hypothetical protein